MAYYGHVLQRQGTRVDVGKCQLRARLMYVVAVIGCLNFWPALDGMSGLGLVSWATLWLGLAQLL